MFYQCQLTRVILETGTLTGCYGCEVCCFRGTCFTTEHAHTNTQRCGRHHCRHGYLECQQQQERLNAVEPSVDKVSHEQVVCVRHIATNLEQLFEVIKLTVNISTDLQQMHVKMVCHSDAPIANIV